MATPKQIAALKFLIFHAKTKSNLVKQLLAFLLDKSEGLTKEVCVTLKQDVSEFSKAEIRNCGFGLHLLLSEHGGVHLHEIMVATGSGFTFSCHYGHIENGVFRTEGQFPSQPEHPKNTPLRYTFWLAKEQYSKTAANMAVTRAELAKIDLSRPGLYPSLESMPATK